MGFEDGLIGEMGHPSNSSTLSPFGDSRALSPGNKHKPLWAKLCAEGDCAYAKDKFLDAAQHYTDSLALMLGLQDKAARSLLLVRRSAGAFSESQAQHKASHCIGECILPVAGSCQMLDRDGTQKCEA
jgi:hypothetical protein